MASGFLPMEFEIDANGALPYRADWIPFRFVDDGIASIVIRSRGPYA